MRFPLARRAAAIAGVAILILLPIRLVDHKIAERQAHAKGVQQRFAQETSGAQTVAGPLLVLACEETYTEERQVMRGGMAETVSEKKIVACPAGVFAPRSLKVTGGLPVQSLYRGLYPIRLYRARLELTGEVEWPEPPAPNGLNPRAWKAASLMVAVRDARGIKQLDGGTLKQELGEYAAHKRGERVSFGYRMQLVGTSSIAIAPVGDTTEIRLASDWPHPSFFGSWSPDERRVSGEGFESVWRTTYHATGGAATWEKAARDGMLADTGAVAGVSLFDPVNVYALSYRATEYGFLFVLFTFAALALTEAVAGVRLHAVQYLLVGSALAVFFLLLIALSEHTSFARAYLAAASACVALLTTYLWHPLGSVLRSGVFLVLFVALYASLYVLLKSEDHALLMGSLMVFGVLSVAMLATRKLDWGSLSRRMVGA